jgi:hypothetical protein
MGEDAELGEDRQGGLFHLKNTRSSFRRPVGFNRPVAESIKAELEQLESLGRVTARDQRPVHSEFGFDEIPRDPQPASAPAGDNVAASLDDAWSRLKRRIKPDE